mgnify:CR=1 FL=1
MKLKILANTATLRLAKELTGQESFQLDEKIDQSRATKREVANFNDELSEEGHFVEKFKNAKININSVPSHRSSHIERAIEQKCPSCFKRVMSVKSLNEHMRTCAISVFTTFYSELERLNKMKFNGKMTTHAYKLYAIKLVFETHKKLKETAKAEGINVTTINSELPPLSESEPLQLTTNNFRRNHYSPDNGYASGGGFTPK